MKNTILSVLAAISVASCSPYSSGKAQEVQNSVGITCDSIVSGTVTDNQVHHFILDQKWSPGQKIVTLYELERIIKGIDFDEPISRDGLRILEGQYKELERLEKKGQVLSEQERSAIQNQHLIELFQVFLRIEHE